MGVSQGVPLAVQVIEHHLRLFGVRADLPLILTDARGDSDRLVTALTDSAVAVVIQPGPRLRSALGLNAIETIDAPSVLDWRGSVRPIMPLRLRSLHSAIAYTSVPTESVAIVADPAGRSVWLWLPRQQGGILVVGSDLAADFVRYRQGDPAAVLKNRCMEMWGICVERPNYLFEDQRSGEAPTCRHADHWGQALALALEHCAGIRRKAMLPGGAPGAIVLTGDDDQAYLETYERQQKLLGRTPITYFLHHQTRHTAKTLRQLKSKPWVDLGIHPDALDSPGDYGRLLKEQMAWYRRVVGQAPESLRNHGFQSDGYWGHLPHWQREGITFSTNLPGLDGNVMNGSLLPARVVADGELTDHWSVLTAFGDGMISALKTTPQVAADKIITFSRELQQSGIPGVMVINLHPQNIAQTAALHEAALAVISEGFLAWNMRQCLAWFRDGDVVRVHADEAGGAWFGPFWRRLRRNLPA